MAVSVLAWFCWAELVLLRRLPGCWQACGSGRRAPRLELMSPHNCNRVIVIVFQQGGGGGVGCRAAAPGPAQGAVELESSTMAPAWRCFGSAGLPYHDNAKDALS